jgi:hypothetical protein
LLLQLQQILTNYLDIPNASGSSRQAPASFTDTAASDLSTFFARRKPQKYEYFFFYNDSPIDPFLFIYFFFFKQTPTIKTVD